MLSSNSSLQNGRYRVIGLFGEADGGRLYDAFDDQLGQKLVIHESTSDDNFSERLNALKNRRIRGVVQIRDGFVEGSNAYLVTEALDGRASADEFIKDPANSIGMLLSGIRSLMDSGVQASSIDVNPQMIRRAQDGNNCLLNFTSETLSAEKKNLKLTPFSALETVWPGLDIVTQKAIANSCDDESLTQIEAPADERTVMFAVASSIYQIIAGKAPLDVLVRSIEILDEKGDPLKPLADVKPSLDITLSNTISGMMAVKRSDRPSLADAQSAVGSLARATTEAIELDLDDELDLLEIPFSEPHFANESSDKGANPTTTTNAELPEPEAHSDSQSVETDRETPREQVAIPTFEKTEKQKEIAAEVKVSSDEDVTAFAMEDSARSSGAGLKIAAAAAGLLIVAVVGWFVLGIGGGTNASASSATPEPKAEPAATKIETPASAPNQVVEPAPNQSAPSANEPMPKTDDSKQPKRPVVAEVKPQAKPTPAKTEKPKKTVTVDDLIRDN